MTGITHVGHFHFFIIIHARDIGFTLRHEVVVVDIVREKQFLYSGKNTTTKTNKYKSLNEKNKKKWNLFR